MLSTKTEAYCPAWREREVSRARTPPLGTRHGLAEPRRELSPAHSNQELEELPLAFLLGKEQHKAFRAAQPQYVLAALCPDCLGGLEVT